jgi:hypothetical protein
MTLRPKRLKMPKKARMISKAMKIKPHKRVIRRKIQNLLIHYQNPQVSRMKTIPLYP